MMVPMLRVVVLEVAADGPLPVDGAALGSGECSLRLSAPRTACRSRCPSFFLISSTTARTTFRAVSLVRSGNPPLERHQRADQLNVRLHAPERLRLEEELLQPLPLDGVLLDDGDHVFLEVVADVAEPLGQPRRRWPSPAERCFGEASSSGTSS